jgi:hypothetical protein
MQGDFVGKKLHKWQGAEWLQSLVRIDDIFERVRAKEFPKRPMRKGSSFVAPTLVAAVKWGGTPSSRFYEVDAQGNIFTTDGEIINDLIHSGRKSDEEVENEARKYWRDMTLASMRRPETIVDGDVTVVREIEPRELRRVTRQERIARREVL